MAEQPDAEEVAYRNIVITYVMNSCASKFPIKNSEIMELLNKNKKLYHAVFPLVKNTLREVYGIIIAEVPNSKSGKKFICYSEITAKTSKECDEEQQREITLLFIILSYIFMSGGSVYSSKLEEFLNGLKINYDEDHPYFGGNLKKLITETFVKQLYLEQEKSESEFDVDVQYLYSWGFRSTVEFDKKSVLDAAANILGKPAETFVAQYDEANKNEEASGQDAT